MKRYVFSLFCAGLAGLAWAADPPAVVAPAPCGPLVCVPEPTVRKIDKVIYDDKCVDYCLPALLAVVAVQGRLLRLRLRENCGRPRVRHVLIKRVVHEECPDVKCEVRQAPCAPPCVPGP